MLKLVVIPVASTWLLVLSGCEAVSVVTHVVDWKQKQDDRKEAQRSRDLPPEELEKLANRLAQKIAAELPAQKSVARNIEEKHTRMVLVRGQVVNHAQFCEPDRAQELMSKMLSDLLHNETFEKYFIIVESRSKSEDLLERSEGKKEIMLEKDNTSESARYAADVIYALELEFFDYDKRGATSWKASVRVWNPANRKVLWDDEMRAPESAPPSAPASKKPH